ncbi:MAG: 50S ribosomal protein L5 [Chloroflexi bacterium]|nr:50S ribosomal protein L5 [Chloroflexota bacterium]MBU1750907.1 50S ribosomal protein L5 [Chloroflexota bacterium]MBU1879650.1 50S ribosomal protein L5 [Chloroflexota bacterium]
MAQVPKLQQRYRDEVVPVLAKEFGYKNVMEIPGLHKVKVNIGLGEAIRDAKVLDAAMKDMVAITGQRPVVTRARKSIAAFKVRAGMPVGLTVTLRGRRMYDFLDRLFNVALPRIRDFRGLSAKSFDGRGNYTIGLREQLIFPEIDYDSIDKLRGLEVCIVTTAHTDAEGRALLHALGLPFRD